MATSLIKKGMIIKKIMPFFIFILSILTFFVMHPYINDFYDFLIENNKHNELYRIAIYRVIIKLDDMHKNLYIEVL